jgi:hypothetical protein
MRIVWCKRINIKNISNIYRNGNNGNGNNTFVCLSTASLPLISSSLSLSSLTLKSSYSSYRSSTTILPIISLSSLRYYSSSNILKDSIQIKDGHTDHIITMPIVGDAKEGTIDEWYKNEGDSFNNGEKLCTVTLDIGLTIAIDAPNSGVLGEIYATAGKPMKIDTPIAMFVENSNQYFAYVEDQRVANMDKEKQAVIEEIKVEEQKKPDAKGLLREIKVLLSNGDINSDSTFAKTLQKLARQCYPDLVSIYEASCDGPDFDKKFFLQNAEEIVTEYEQEQLKSKN